MVCSSALLVASEASAHEPPQDRDRTGQQRGSNRIKPAYRHAIDRNPQPQTLDAHMFPDNKTYNTYYAFGPSFPLLRQFCTPPNN
eukprot:1486934-Amphidinium_carterae.1